VAEANGATREPTFRLCFFLGLLAPSAASGAARSVVID